MGTIVQKYGGSSIATHEKMRKVAEHVKKTVESGKDVVVVVSAMGKTTNWLLQLAKEVGGDSPPRRELDRLLGTGEEQSAPLLAMAIYSLGVPAVSLTSRDIRLEADSNGLVKRIKDVEAIRTWLNKGWVVVVTGFQGVIEGTNDIVALGRGGSDHTAVALAVALNVPKCEIYTDVDGVHLIDPRIVPAARKLENISFDQMIGLAGAGVGVLMNRCVILARALGVNIQILKSPSIEGQDTGGTLVCPGSTLEEMEGFLTHVGIAIRSLEMVNISKIPHIPGAGSKLFAALKDINIIDAKQSEDMKEAKISLFCFPDTVGEILSRLQALRDSEALGSIKVSKPSKLVAFALVDQSMKDQPGYLKKVFAATERAKTNIETFFTADKAIMVMVKEEDIQKTAQALAEEFDLLA